MQIHTLTHKTDKIEYINILFAHIYHIHLKGNNHNMINLHDFVPQQTIDELSQKAMSAYKASHDLNHYDTDYDRLNFVNDEFEEMLDYIRDSDELYSEAEQYVFTRNALNGLLQPLQDEIVDVLKKIEIDKTFDVIPASSFTAKTYLIGESDLDINFLIDDIYFLDVIQITRKLQDLGYDFVENRGIGKRLRYVFGKTIVTEAGQAEIEIKVRDMKYFKDKLQGVHSYLDNDISEKEINSITFMKYILSAKQKGYSAFKALYYEWGNYHYITKNNGTYDLIYPYQ